MLKSQIPTKFVEPFGANATAGLIRTIPAASQIGIVNGAASLNDGFPPLTATPLASGGVPPSIQDFNGILNQVSAWDMWTAAAGITPFDAVFQAAIGGYPQGAVVCAGTTAVPGRVWISTTDNNATNPDSGGSGWLAMMLASDVLALIAANAPVTLRASKTLNVDISGNDTTGNGTSGAPFLTIARAIAYAAQSFNFAGFALIIQLVTAGSYAAPGVVTGVPNIQIIGNTSNIAGYILTGAFTNGACLNVSQCSCTVSGLTINNTATNSGWTSVSQGSLSIDHVSFTSDGQTSTFSLMLAGAGGTFAVNTGCNIYGINCSTVMSVGTGGNFSYNATLSIFANVVVSSAWLVASNCGVWIATISGGSYGTGGGATITGTRYIVSSNASVNTQGGGASYFPGTVAGSTSTGGQYV